MSTEKSGINGSGLRNVQLRSSTLGIVNALALVGAAYGQTAPAPEASTNSTTQLPEMRVLGEADPNKPEILSTPRVTEPIRDVPQTISVIPQTIIRQQNATSLRDILKNVSGISMQAGEGGGGLPGDNLSLRGSNARSDIFVDGARDYGAYSRDPFNTEQVEVFKGPSSAIFGRGSVGGSILMTSKRPTLERLYSGALGGGTDDYVRLTTDFNQPLGEIGLPNSAVRLNGLWHEADAPGRDVVESKRWAIAPGFTYGLGTQTRATLMFQHMSQDNVPDYGIPWVPANTNPALAQYSNQAPPVDFGNFYGLRNYDFEKIENDFGTAIIDHDFSETVRLRNLTRVGRTDRDSAITAPRFRDIATSTDINRQLQRRQMEHTAFINLTDANFTLETGPIEHAVATGLELSREEQDNRNGAQATNQPTTDLFNPSPDQLPLGPMPAITAPWTDGRADTVGAYVADTLKFAEKWELIGSVRYDRIWTDFYDGTNALSRTDDLLSWRSGLVFKPVEPGSIYFGYGTSYNPSLEGNTGLTGNFINLDPEKARIYELGTKWDLLKERLLVSAAIFRIEKYNVRTPELGGTGNTVTEGEQRIHGFEFGAHGSITPNWTLKAEYTLMDGKVEESNVPAEMANELSNVPDHSASLWSVWTLPHGFEIGAGVNYTGNRYTNNNSATRRKAEDYVTFDATAAYHFNEYFTLRFNIYNIADDEHIAALGGGHFIPGAGRSAVLTASYSY